MCPSSLRRSRIPGDSSCVVVKLCVDVFESVGILCVDVFENRCVVVLDLQFHVSAQ